MKIFVRTIYFGALFLVISGCTTSHYSQAILYKGTNHTQAIKTSTKQELPYQESKIQENEYKISESWNNPVYVDEESSFKIIIDKINPGWVHWDTKRDVLKHGRTRRLREDTTQHVVGKELWLLTKIESLSSEDILERHSKFYFKATNVKFNSGSFKPLALDIDERDIFQHRADSPYRITFKLYEVDGFDLKKAFLRAHDASPGLAGLVVAAKDSFTSAAEGILGSVVADLWKKGTDEQLFVERVLLESGGSLEFQGSLLVLREKNILNNTMLPALETSYLLYDPFKSNGSLNGFNNKEEYISTLNQIPTSLSLNSPEQRTKCVAQNGSSSLPSLASCETYIKLTVAQAYPPDSPTGKTIEQVKANMKAARALPPIDPEQLKKYNRFVNDLEYD